MAKRGKKFQTWIKSDINVAKMARQSSERGLRVIKWEKLLKVEKVA